MGTESHSAPHPSPANRTFAAEQQPHLILDKPDRFTIESYLDAGVVAFIEDEKFKLLNNHGVFYTQAARFLR